MNQDIRIVVFADNFLFVGHEVWRDVTPIKLHTLHNVHFGVCGFAFFDGDHAVAGANTVHRFSKLLANLAIVVSGDGRHFGNDVLVFRVDFLSKLVQ